MDPVNPKTGEPYGKRFGYAFQMAFYRAVLREAVGEKSETVALMLLESLFTQPFLPRFKTKTISDSGCGDCLDVTS